MSAVTGLDVVPMIVHGQPVHAEATFEVRDPATEQVCGLAPICSRDQLDQAMQSAATAYASWSLDDDARRAAMRACAAALVASAPRLSAVLVSEQGKPLAEARSEIEYAAAWLGWFADLDLDREVVRSDEHQHAEVFRSPMGVVAAITPWNFPINLAVWKIAPALRAGNTMVLKPSPYTPLTTLLLGEVLAQHLPPGVLNVVSGPDPLGEWMTTHPVPRKVSFTGSTAAGRKVMAAAAPTLKRVTLELGGNDAAIVLPDADPVAIAPTLFWGAFLNNGQVCLAAKRVFVHESVHDALAEALAAVASASPVGPGAAEGTLLGPVNNRAQYDKVVTMVAAALDQGASAVSGGAALPGPGYFFPPTILTGTREGMSIVDEEQFGPALPLLRYSDINEAVDRANASEFGLTGSVWSQDLDLAASIARRLDVGSVSVNQHAGAVAPDLPFGGHKASGMGLENGLWGLHSYTDTQAYAGPRAPS